MFTLSFFQPFLFKVNGLSIDLTSQWGDPFQLLDSVRGELETMERLAKLGVSGEKAQEILRAPVPKGESEPVLKISDSNVRNFLICKIMILTSLGMNPAGK